MAWIPDVNRRNFLAIAGGVAAAITASGAPSSTNGPRRGIWIDPKLASLPARPWRKVHLDFHNTPFIKSIGEKFNADEFGDRLLEGNVSGIVVFAKDMHGYFYYPSKFEPVHPGLKFDLLGQQVEACRKRGIKVYGYYCTAWDNYLAENHPEWLTVKRDRTTYLPKFDETPSWTALCASNADFVKLQVAQVREYVERYPLDGAWLDMPEPISGECYCHECLRQIRSKGLDPFSRDVQFAHQDEVWNKFLRSLYDAVKSARPGCMVDFNGQVSYGLKERVPATDNVDIEALPTGFWGYYYFPLAVRYVRTFGVTNFGLTGRFELSWADFGGLKLPAQLETELASIVANGAHCGVGDQLAPNGRLDPAVYHVLGKSFGRIKTLEPYLDQAVPVTEAALLIAGKPLEKFDRTEYSGFTKLLIEMRVQFDVVEPDAPWERYALIVLPDNLPVTPELAARVHAYIGRGGSVIASHLSGVLTGTETSWIERYGFRYAGVSPFKPAYMAPKVSFTADMPAFEYALYEGASQWEASAPAQVLAQLGEPAFQRSPQHYTSHAQSPFDHLTRFCAVGQSGSLAVFGFPLGESYFKAGYWVYRDALRYVLERLLPTPIIQTNAPLSTEVTVTHQDARPDIGRKERYLVHVVNFSPLRNGGGHPAYYEDPIALTDVNIRLNLPLKARSARALVAGVELPASNLAGGGVEVKVPRIPIQEVLCFEIG